MTNNEYTPTTDEVEENYIYGQMTLSAEDAGAEFDRWLDTTIRQAKAEALREASERLARAAFRVNSIHHLYLPAGDERPRCTCGFVGDARKRTQTEHLTNAVLGEFDASRIEAGE